MISGSALSSTNRLVHSYHYSSLNRLTNLVVDKAGTLKAQYQYTLGPAGNRLGVAELGGRERGHRLL